MQIRNWKIILTIKYYFTVLIVHEKSFKDKTRVWNIQTRKLTDSQHLLVSVNMNSELLSYYSCVLKNCFVHVTKSCTSLESYLSSAVIFWTSLDGWVLSVQWSDSWCSKAPTHSSPLAKNTLTTWSWTWRIFPTGSDRIYNI